MLLRIYIHIFIIQLKLKKNSIKCTIIKDDKIYIFKIMIFLYIVKHESTEHSSEMVKLMRKKYNVRAKQ